MLEKLLKIVREKIKKNKKEHQEIKRKEEGGKNMLVQYYRYNNIFIQQIEQYGDKWANVYILTDNDYRICTAIPRSTAKWRKQGYKKIKREELVQELETRGYGEEIIL
jgi:predicted type IV restriction endonuclease